MKRTRKRENEKRKKRLQEMDRHSSKISKKGKQERGESDKEPEERKMNA